MHHGAQKHPERSIPLTVPVQDLCSICDKIGAKHDVVDVRIKIEEGHLGDGALITYVLYLMRVMSFNRFAEGCTR
jgi:hypothetical protein